MRFNVDYREDATGLMKGGKCYYLIGRVEFIEEEKAIIEQRGLYDHSITIPSGDAPVSTAKYVGSGLFKVVGVILMPIGLVAACGNKIIGNGSYAGSIMFFLGLGCFAYSWFVDKEAKTALELEQTLTARRLLGDPEFKCRAPDIQVAKGFEIIVREELGKFAQLLRDSASVPEKTSYEL
jgi:hypothetical protein